MSAVTSGWPWTPHAAAPTRNAWCGYAGGDASSTAAGGQRRDLVPVPLHDTGADPGRRAEQRVVGGGRRAGRRRARRAPGRAGAASHLAAARRARAAGAPRQMPSVGTPAVDGLARAAPGSPAATGSRRRRQAPIAPPSTSSPSYAVSGRAARRRRTGARRRARRPAAAQPVAEPARPGARPRAGRRGPRGRSPAQRRHSTGEVAVQLERRDLAAVVVPLGPLVAQEEVEDVLAERLGDQLAALHRPDRLGQAGRQRLDAERPPLAVGQRPDVVLGALAAARSPPRCP